MWLLLQLSATSSSWVGVLVVDSGSNVHPPSTCVTDPSATMAHSSIIATQCCDSTDSSNNGCRRRVGNDDDVGCVGGKPARAYTFSQAGALCSELNLALCDRDCFVP